MAAVHGVRVYNIVPKNLLQALRSNNAILSPRYISGRSIPRLTLYTKEVCPLCDIAKEVLEPFKHRFVFEEVDITSPENKEWFDKYKYDIPVFHLNDKFLMKHKVNTQLLEYKLTQLESE